MITFVLSERELAERRALWERAALKPTSKSAEEVIAYAASRYDLREVFSADALELVSESVMQSPFFRQKLPEGALPSPRAFILPRSDANTALFDDMSADGDIWGDLPRIFFGIDLRTGWFTAEGSALLYDELLAFRGLDAFDLDNYIVASEYIYALRRFGKSAI